MQSQGAIDPKKKEDSLTQFMQSVGAVTPKKKEDSLAQFMQSQGSQLPKLPDFYKPVSPIPKTIPPEMIETMWKGMGETAPVKPKPTLPELTAQTLKTLGGGINLGFSHLLGLKDVFAEKILPKEDIEFQKKIFPNIIEELTGEDLSKTVKGYFDKSGQQLMEEGLEEGSTAQLFVAGTGIMLPTIITLSAMGPVGLPILSAAGFTEQLGAAGVPVGTAHGAMLHKIITASNVLPKKIRIPVLYAFGFITSQGDLKQRFADAALWGGLGSIGKEGMPLRKLKSKHKALVTEPEKAIKEIFEEKITEKDLEPIGGAEVVADRIAKTLETEDTVLAKRREQLLTKKYPPGIPKDAENWRAVWDVTGGRGVAPYKDASGKFIELEEYQNMIPKQLRRKDSPYAPDKVAQLLKLEEGDRGLYEFLRHKKQSMTEAEYWEEEGLRMEEEARGRPRKEKPSQAEIIKTEAEILRATNKSSEHISKFIKNDFMDGERLREITNEVIAGKKTQPEATKEIKGLIEDTVGTEGFKEVSVGEVGIRIAQLKERLGETKDLGKKRIIQADIEKLEAQLKGEKEEPGFKLTAEEAPKKVETPKTEQEELFEMVKGEAKPPLKFKDINKWRKEIQPWVEKGYVVEYGDGWARVVEQNEPGKGKLISKAKAPEFGVEKEVQLGISDEATEKFEWEKKKVKIAGEEVEAGKIFEKVDHGKVVSVEATKPKGWYEVEYEDGFKATTKNPPKLSKEPEFKVKEEWKVKATPEEQMRMAEREVDEALREIGGLGEELIGETEGGEPISMISKEQMKRAGEAGYIKLEVGKTFGKSIKTKVYQDIFDRFHSIKKLTDIVKKEGAELPAIKDPYMGIRNYLGVQGKAETKIFYKRFKVDEQGNLRFEGESLKDIVKPVKENLDDFRRYLVDRRVPELEGRGIETGRDVKEAEKFIKEHVKEFEPYAKKYTEYMHSLLDELQESGFLSKSKLETIKSHNQMYAPFQRVIEDIEQHGYIPSSTKILSKITSPLKRIKGSERPIIDPLESAIEATYRITNVVERNRIANQIIDLRKMSPEIARIIKPTKPQMSVTVLEDGTKVYRPSAYQKEGIIEVMEKGKRHFYEVPKELYEAMSQLDKVGYGWMTKLLAAPARLLRTGATTTPEFAFRNPVRDQWFAFVNAKHGYIPGWDLAKGLFTLVRKPELYWKWKASGGEWSMLVTLDRAANQATIKKVLGIKDYKKYMKNPIGFFEDVSMVGEIPTRLGVFERAQKKVSDIEAAYESREGSIDFARRGAKTKTISALYTFLNARLQGMEKLIRTAKERPVVTAAKIMAVAVIPSVVNYLINRDDPDYWEIPEWQRDLFWIIPVRRSKGVMGKKPIYLRIPKGDVGVIFGTTTEKVLEFMDKDKEGKLELDKLAVSIIKESMPISDVGGFLPVVARIPVELMANEKFFYGRPIVSQGKEMLEPRYQYSPFTSETAKAIGKVFNISPAKIEHLITGYGAGMARYALELNDGILGEMGVLPKKPERPTDLSDIPVVKAFTIRDPRGFGSESVQNFYDTLEGIERFSATEKKLKQEGKGEERIKYIKSHEVEFIATQKKLDTEFRKAQGDLAALRKIRDRVLDDREITKEQKEEVMNEINAFVMAKVITVLSKYRALEAIKRKKKK